MNNANQVYSFDIAFNWNTSPEQIRLSSPLPTAIWSDYRHSCIIQSKGQWSGSFSYIGENRWQRPALLKSSDIFNKCQDTVYHAEVCFFKIISFIFVSPVISNLYFIPCIHRYTGTKEKAM